MDGEGPETELAYGDLVLRLDGPVIEVLSIGRDKPLRIHVNHALVSLQPAKHGIEVRGGTDYRNNENPGQGPLVTDDKVSAPWGPFSVEADEESRLRAFFDE